MKLYNLLTNGYEYNNFYELLFSNYLSNDTPEINEYTGVLPYTFTANGAALLDWYIKGNTGGVGDRTGNLFDLSTATNEFINSNGSITPAAPGDPYYLSDYISADSVTISVQFKETAAAEIFTVGIYDSSKSFIQRDVISNNSVSYENVAYIRINYRDKNCQNVMLNSGSTALSYEPYGYKIPVICGDETTNIYIDAPLDASDMITMSDVNVSIPTVQGSNTISVDTTVQPSEIYIKYIGG